MTVAIDDDLRRWMHRLPLVERLALQRRDEQMQAFKPQRQADLQPMSERCCPAPGCNRRLSERNRSGVCSDHVYWGKKERS